MSEAQINTYLKRLLGPGAPQPVVRGEEGSVAGALLGRHMPRVRSWTWPAPRPLPQWGVKDGGWHTYVAKLLTWCSGKEVTPEQAKQVASRQQGRSWELNQEMLDSLGCVAQPHMALALALCALHACQVSSAVARPDTAGTPHWPPVLLLSEAALPHRLRPTTWELPLSKAGAAAAPAERMQIEPAGAESDGEVNERRRHVFFARVCEETRAHCTWGPTSLCHHPRAVPIAPVQVWDRLISLTNDMIQRTKGAPAKQVREVVVACTAILPHRWQLSRPAVAPERRQSRRRDVCLKKSRLLGAVCMRIPTCLPMHVIPRRCPTLPQAPNAQEAAFVEAAQKLARLVGMPLVEASRAQNWPAFGGEVQGGASARGGARDGVGGLGKGPLALFKGGGAAVGPNGDPPKPAAAQSAVMIGNGILGQAPIPIKHALPPDLSRLLAGPKKEEEVSVSGGVRAARGDTGAEAAGPVASADGGPGAREAGPAPLQLGVGSQDLLVPARAVPGSQDFWMGSGRAGTSQGLHDVPGSPDRNRVHGRGGYGKAGAAKTLSPRRAPIP